MCGQIPHIPGSGKILPDARPEAERACAQDAQDEEQQNALGRGPAVLSEHVVKQQRKHKRDELRDDGVEGVGNREVDRILGNGAVGHGLHAVTQIGDAALDLGVMNLLPLPALDGGRLVFLVIEAIRRKPVNREIEGRIHLAGLMLLMALMVVVMYNDILKIF